MSTNLDRIISELQEERNRIDRALQALLGVRSGTFTKRVQTKALSPATQGRMKRRLSASARRKIAEAQKARWARIKAGQKKK